MNKLATTNYEIIEVIKNRWSPRAFSNEAILKESLQKIFEAMCWAPSCYNEQPWRLIVGIKGHDEAYDKIFACLNEWNQRWAKTAPVLILMIGKKHFTHNDEYNRSYQYDCGAAATHLCLQAISEGIYSHQMAGILPNKAYEYFDIEREYEVLTAIALGKIGNLNDIPDDYHASEKNIRNRRSPQSFVYGDEWGQAHKYLFSK